MKTILITGATSGIGKASAEIFAKEGFKLILTGRRKERLEEITTRLSDEYQNEIHILNFDVQDRTATEKAIASLPEKFQHIDVLLNNAGLALGRETIDESDMQDWETMIDTNVKGLLYVSRAVLPIMKAQNFGQIINISSIAAKEVYANGNVYCATKHAVDAITKSMQIDLLKYNIKVSSVAPGMVDTEFSTVRFKGDSKTADETYNGFVPLYAQDIAEVIQFVVSRPAHVNIHDILVMPSAQATATIVKKEN
jgi:3-hydroxy acid dehydrogenase/malonic semialdehyde reductase